MDGRGYEEDALDSLRGGVGRSHWGDDVGEVCGRVGGYRIIVIQQKFATPK